MGQEQKSNYFKASEINVEFYEDPILNGSFISMLDKIFDGIPMPFIILDENCVIRMMNDTFAEYLGYKKENAIGKYVLEVDKNSRFPFVYRNRKAEIACKHTFQNGKTAIVHRLIALDKDGNVKYGIGLVLFENLTKFKDVMEKNNITSSDTNANKKALKEIHEAKYSWDDIIGRSEKMSQAKFIGKRASQSNSNVLILGESGTGKELFANAIHNDSARKYNPFIEINCAAIPSELLESELFGYEEGAFTGAKKGGKIGKFELADTGSIFLDEIGDMPLKMQAKLLRVLQEREFEKVGGNKVVKIDVRVISATNKNLEKMVKEGKFREDLYYRLNVMTIMIPSLRERKEDLNELTPILISKLSNQLGKYVTNISEDAQELLLNYNWQGNVRELENVLERAINLADSDTILPAHLPSYIRKKAFDSYASEDSQKSIISLKEAIEKAEKDSIIKCLEYTKGNKLKTAKLLDMSRSSLYEKMERYQIEGL